MESSFPSLSQPFKDSEAQPPGSLFDKNADPNEDTGVSGVVVVVAGRRKHLVCFFDVCTDDVTVS